MSIQGLQQQLTHEYPVFTVTIESIVSGGCAEHVELHSLVLVLSAAESIMYSACDAATAGSIQGSISVKLCISRSSQCI